MAKGFRNLLGLLDRPKPALASELTSALEDAQREAAATQDDVDRLGNAYERAVLAGGEEFEAHEAAAAAALAKAKAADRRVAVLREKLAKTAKAEADAEVRAAYERQQVVIAAEAKRSAAEVKRIVGSLAAELVKVATVDDATAALNARLPSDLPPLPTVESLYRDIPGEPVEVVSVEQVDLWVQRGTSEPLAEPLQDEVVAHSNDPRRGHRIVHARLSATETRRQVLDCDLKRFKRERYLPSTPSRVGPRLQELHLPGIGPFDPAYWSPFGFNADADMILRRAADLAAEKAAKPEPEARKELVRLTLLDLPEPAPKPSALLSTSMRL